MDRKQARTGAGGSSPTLNGPSHSARIPTGRESEATWPQQDGPEGGLEHLLFREAISTAAVFTRETQEKPREVEKDLHRQ